MFRSKFKRDYATARLRHNIVSGPSVQRRFLHDDVKQTFATLGSMGQTDLDRSGPIIMADNAPEKAPTPSEPTPLFKNPVFLTAFFGAVIAALANAYVALTNNNALVDVELHKESEEQVIESRKAEFTRLLEISKLDVAPAKQKIQAFCEMQLITDSAICLASKGGSASQANTQSTSPVTSSSATWDSPWVGGGHNQQEICNNGVAELGKNDQFKGKVISIQSASEDSRKDLFGHVEYRYHCTYRVSETVQPKP